MSGAKYIVCHDPQCRLGEVTWAVVEVSHDGEYINSLGLFWAKDIAEQFATNL